MDISVHNRILWFACVEAEKRLPENQRIADPRVCFPWLVRGSWMNDINQATLFSDNIPGAEVELQRFFNELWRQHLKELISDLKDEMDVELHNKMYTFVTENSDSESVYEIGKYINYDHLDIPNYEQIPEIEKKAEYEFKDTYDSGNFLRSKTVNYTIKEFLKSHLRKSTLRKNNDEKLDSTKISILGRVLHTIQDFYAHTNYVELLLWELSWKGNLDTRIVNASNSPSRLFIDPSRRNFICPLPGKDDLNKLRKKDTIFRYGNSPIETPLVSSLFDLRDTAFTLLQFYAKHLENISEEPSLSDRNLDFVMAIFDIPGKSVIKNLYKIGQEVQKAFDNFERLARNFLADQVINLVEDKSAKYKSAFDALATAIRSYDSNEAKEWARAGKLRYVAYMMKCGLADEMNKINPETILLPHHSLLYKDRLLSQPEDALRYRLACILATEITTELLIWHFSKNSSADGYDNLAQKYLIHPSLQLEKKRIDVNKMQLIIDKAYGLRWPSLLGSPNIV